MWLVSRKSDGTVTVTSAAALAVLLWRRYQHDRGGEIIARALARHHRPAGVP